jgi:hypothetical protein
VVLETNPLETLAKEGQLVAYNTLAFGTQWIPFVIKIIWRNYGILKEPWRKGEHKK